MSEERRRVQHPGGGVSKTRQSDALQSDVNAIMSKYVQTGLVSQRAERGTYGDFSSGLTFHEAMNAVREAESDFWQLPPQVRRKCKNDPGEFLDMVFDPDRRHELEELGLREEDAPEKAPPASKPPEEEQAPPAPGGATEGGQA